MPLTTRTSRQLTRIAISVRVLLSAEQAFMAVQMLVIEIDDPWLEDQLDKIADTLDNDERYRPGQFAAMLASLAEPEPDTETDAETDDEPATE